MRPPQLRCKLFLPIYLPHLHQSIVSSSYRTSTSFAALSSTVAFYVISVRRFGSLPASIFFLLTSGFLQIPPHDGHPCLRLTLPTAERVVVSHHLVVAHAGRTRSGCPPISRGSHPVLLSPCWLL